MSGHAQVKARFVRHRLKLSGPRSPPLPLGSPVQSQTAVRVWFQQLFALGPTLERGELSSRQLGKRTACHDAAPLKPCMSAIERAGELACSALNHVDEGPCLGVDPHRIQSIALLRATPWVK